MGLGRSPTCWGGMNMCGCSFACQQPCSYLSKPQTYKWRDTNATSFQQNPKRSLQYDKSQVTVRCFPSIPTSLILIPYQWQHLNPSSLVGTGCTGSIRERRLTSFHAVGGADEAGRLSPEVHTAHRPRLAVDFDRDQTSLFALMQ